MFSWIELTNTKFCVFLDFNRCSIVFELDYGDGFVTSFNRIPFTDPIFLILLFVFFTVFLSGFWSIDKKQWSWFSRMMLPFLIIPFALLRIGSVPKKWIHIFWLHCIACLFYTSLFIVKDYIFNGDKVNQMIMKGGASTTPISHIRYSLIVACVIIILSFIFLFFYFFYFILR